jgi:hypothetical protein
MWNAIRHAHKNTKPRRSISPPPETTNETRETRKIPGPHITSAISFLFKKRAVINPRLTYTNTASATKKIAVMLS